MHRRGDLLQDVAGAEVEDRVHGIEAKSIDVKLRDPVESVVHEVAPHFIAVGAVEIDRPAPRRAVHLAEVGPEVLEIVAFGPEMVVHHVEHDREPRFVRRVHEATQPIGPTVAVLRGVREDAVVAPVALARKRRHGHELDRRDAEVAKLRQVLGHAVERAGLREGAGVQLVDHELVHVEPRPRGIRPAKGGGVHHS